MVPDKFAIRTAVTILVGPLILFLSWLGGYYFLAFVCIICLLGMYEFYRLSARKGAAAAIYLGLLAGVAVCLCFFYQRPDLLWLVLVGTTILCLLGELFRDVEAPILNVSATMMGLLYVAIPFAFLIALRQFPAHAPLQSRGGSLVMMVFLCIWVCDSAAYIFGSRWGRHKLFPRVSPNKTVEGTFAGFLFSLLTAYASYLTFLLDFELRDALVVGAICGSFGQLSDLIESLFKRDAGVKDASNLIPGHGGVLDRFDSEILAVPLVYLYLRYVVGG